jgi:hypothetical protein
MLTRNSSKPDSENRFSFSNFMRVHLFSALATLKIEMDILFEENK